jgi:hypothetical protein
MQSKNLLALRLQKIGPVAQLDRASRFLIGRVIGSNPIGHSRIRPYELVIKAKDLFEVDDNWSGSSVG